MLHDLTMDAIVQQILHHIVPSRKRETVLPCGRTLSLSIFLSQIVSVEGGQFSE